jgi:pimeloyl-ACP methyl ester carboxylesterase
MDAVEIPRTRYARSGAVSVAYQVLGAADVDLVYVPGWISHLDLQWGDPTFARFLRRLASFSRLMVFDKRGVGLSDPVGSAPTFEDRMDDVRVVMDAAGSRRAALLGFSEGGPLASLFAATYPDRTAALILYGTFAVGPAADMGVPGGPEFARLLDRLRRTIDDWGEGRALELLAPSLAGTDAIRVRYGAFERAAASPAMAAALLQAIAESDVREVLPAIRVPTLVLHRADDTVPIAHGRYLAGLIPDARFVELPGSDHLPMAGDIETIADEIQEFLTGVRQAREPDRVLASVLLTDIVDSTRRAAELGDRAWRDLLARHDALVRAQIQAFGGREVKQTGDGFLATFDGPARAVGCARTAVDGARGLGIEVRAGLHTGEIELLGADVGGLAVHIAARIAALAGPSEVLVSQTVRDLVLGSGLHLESRGTHTLKGVPDGWRLYAVVPASAVAGALS